jgi:hypothetical protein
LSSGRKRKQKRQKGAKRAKRRENVGDDEKTGVYRRIRKR